MQNRSSQPLHQQRRILFILFFFRGYLNDLNGNDPTGKWSAEMHRSLLFKFFEFFNDLNDNDATE